ncbi:MAG: hypothetical protein OK438_07890 [Thaumarchaeota archaeon]|nr:hypothetical protein [Nitrososphaerota archaeon]
MTGINLVAPSGWTITGCAAGVLFNAVTFASGACQFTYGAGGATINPGSTDSLGVTVTPKASATHPISGTFTTTVQDASSAAFYVGPSFGVQVMAAGTTVAITVTPGGTNTNVQYTAGTAVYAVSVLVAPVQAGLTINWSDAGTGAADASYPSSFAAASSTTASDGTASTTYQPSETHAKTGIPTATIGTSAVSSADASTIVTVAGAPTGQSISFASTDATSGNHYIINSGTTVNHFATAFSGATEAGAFFSISLTDAFSNPVLLNVAGLTAWSVRIVAGSGGMFDASDAVFNLATTLSCSNGGNWQDGSGNNLAPLTACPGGAISSFPIPFAYFQSRTYGFANVINVAFHGTFNTVAFTPAGTTSTQLITSALGGVGTVHVYDPVAVATDPAAVVAGGSVIVYANLTYAQAGVPVNFTLSTSSAGYAGTFSNGLQTIIVSSTKTGTYGSAQATFAIDTDANTPASTGFSASNNEPIDGLVPNWQAPVATIGVTTTSVAAAAALAVRTYFTSAGTIPAIFTQPTSHSVAGLTLQVDVQLQDAYGNFVIYTGLNQLQVTLSASAGLLGATTVYIKPGGSTTGTSYGSIAWTMPSSGSTVSLSASAVVGGHQLTGMKTVTIVSKTPTFLLTAPTATAGVYYSKGTFVQFAGGANSSLGYPVSDVIASVGYSIAGGAHQYVAGFSPMNKATFNLPLTLSTGLTSITFNATDSHSNTVTSSPLSVLVDPTGPTITFPTAPISLSNGSPLAVTVVSAQGDLNVSSIHAWYNGTAIAASAITVTGTNTLGSSSSFTVTIGGIPSGTSTVKVSASSYSGITNTKSASVTIIVAFATSVVVSGSPSKTTIGGYTGISATYTNGWSSSQSLIMFAVWKNSAGQTVAVSTGGLTLAAGASGSAFAPLLAPLPSGSYTVNVFVWTTNNLSVSSTSTITVTV